MFICSLGGVDHNNLGDMVYKYVWLLYIHIKSAMMRVQGNQLVYPTQLLFWFLMIFEVFGFLSSNI